MNMNEFKPKKKKNYVTNYNKESIKKLPQQFCTLCNIELIKIKINKRKN